MQVQLLLLDTLDELGVEEFKKFRWILTQPVLDRCQPIRKGYIENADRQDTISKMIETYGEESAVNMTVEILKRMNQNNGAEKLRRTYAETNGKAGGADHELQGGSTAVQTPYPPASSSSPSGLTPAAPAGANVCAQGKSVIVAPNIAGTGGVSFNLNINTQ